MQLTLGSPLFIKVYKARLPVKTKQIPIYINICGFTPVLLHLAYGYVSAMSCGWFWIGYRSALLPI